MIDKAKAGLLIRLAAAAFVVLALNSGSVLSQEATSSVSLLEVKSLKGYNQGTFSPKARFVALKGIDNIDLVEIATNEKLYTISIPRSYILHVAYSAAADRIAAGYQDKSGRDTKVKVQLWEASTGREIRTLPIIDDDWTSAGDVSFTDDGRLLATSIGNVARIWDVQTGEIVREFYPPSKPAGMYTGRAMISRDGKWLAVHFTLWDPPTKYDSVYIYNLETGSERVLDTNVYENWKFSADSSMLAITATADRGKITQRSVAEVWHVESGIRLQVIDVRGRFVGAFSLDFSPDGELLAVGGRRKFGIFSVATGAILAEATHDGGTSGSELYYDLSHIEFSQKKRWLLTGSEGGLVKLWRVRQL